MQLHPRRLQPQSGPGGSPLAHSRSSGGEAYDARGQRTRPFAAEDRGANVQVARRPSRSCVGRCPVTGHGHFVTGIYATGGQAQMQAKLKTITAALQQWGFDLWPPTPAKVHALGATLEAGGYLASANYPSAFKVVAGRLGFVSSPSLQRSLRDAVRSCERGQSAARQALPLPMDMLHLLPGDRKPWTAGGPCAPGIVSWRASDFSAGRPSSPARGLRSSSSAVPTAGRTSASLGTSPPPRPTRRQWAPPGPTTAAAARRTHFVIALSMPWSTRGPFSSVSSRTAGPGACLTSTFPLFPGLDGLAPFESRLCPGLSRRRPAHGR